MSNGQVQAKNTKPQAITLAQKKEWPGITDVFKPHEIGWIPNFSRATRYWTAAPYPYVNARLRLAHADHAEGGLSILTELEMVDEKSCIIIARVTTRKGEFVARKAGKLDDRGDVTIEKIETGAVGRALSFAGYGVGAPSAEEVSMWIEGQGNDKSVPEATGEDEQSDSDASEGEQSDSDDGGDDASLQSLKSSYLDYLEKNSIFENEGQKKMWQRTFIGKSSTRDWTKEDTKQAMKLISWRVEVAGDQADAFFSALTKAMKSKGLLDAFLERMQVERITDIEDINGWASMLELAAKEIGVEFQMDEQDIPI